MILSAEVMKTLYILYSTNCDVKVWKRTQWDKFEITTFGGRVIVMLIVSLDEIDLYRVRDKYILEFTWDGTEYFFRFGEIGKIVNIPEMVKSPNVHKMGIFGH